LSVFSFSCALDFSSASFYYNSSISDLSLSVLSFIKFSLFAILAILFGEDFSFEPCSDLLIYEISSFNFDFEFFSTNFSIYLNSLSNY